LVQYLGYFWPGIIAGWPRATMIIVIVVTLTVVNVIGVRDAALFSDVFSIGKLIPIVLFIVAGLFFLNPQNFSMAAQPALSDFSQSVLLLIYAFTGFEMALIPAGEARDPQRNTPFALLTSLAIVATVYILIQVVCIGVLPELAESNRPVADASERFLGAAGASVITAGVVISIIGNLSVLILAAARLPFAMAGNRELPQVLAATHRSFRTPHAAIIVTGAVMLALALSGTFIYAATISTIARLLAYVAACSGLIVLRRRDKQPAQFKVPAGVAGAIAALVLIVWLLANSTGREARDAAIAAITGLIIFGAYKLKRKTAAPAAQIS
jgi:amino acid transporter